MRDAITEDRRILSTSLTKIRKEQTLNLIFASVDEIGTLTKTRKEQTLNLILDEIIFNDCS